MIAGYVIAWAVRKARRAAGPLDDTIDTVIDTSLDRLHETVAAKLAGHPVLADLDEETTTGARQASELTRQQIELALTAAARKDSAFAATVTDLLSGMRAAEQAIGISVIARDGARIQTGGGHATADQGGIAFGQVAGDIHLNQNADWSGPGPMDPPVPGRSTH